MTLPIATRLIDYALLQTVAARKGTAMEIINLGVGDGLPPVDWRAVVEKLDDGSSPAPDAPKVVPYPPVISVEPLFPSAAAPFDPCGFALRSCSVRSCGGPASPAARST